jgi:hypothetical protein
VATFQQAELFPTVRPQTPDSFVKRLRDAVPQPVRVHFTRNRVTMISVRFDADGMAVVRLHERFLRAPVEVLDALGGYVATRDAAAWQRVADYARQIELPAADVRQHDPHAARGGTYDLDAIFHDINMRFFSDKIRCAIRWGRQRARRRRRGRQVSIRFGSWHRAERCIRIHPLLDDPQVPREFIDYIVFHEMLHVVVPSQRAGGRSIDHPPEFQQLERTFPGYARMDGIAGKLLRRLT